MCPLQRKSNHMYKDAWDANNTPWTGKPHWGVKNMEKSVPPHERYRFRVHCITYTWPTQKSEKNPRVSNHPKMVAMVHISLLAESNVGIVQYYSSEQSRQTAFCRRRLTHALSLCVACVCCVLCNTPGNIFVRKCWKESRKLGNGCKVTHKF